MSSAESALRAIGEDCDCGHPLVWHHGERWCAVYGSHRAPVIVRPPAEAWNKHAPFARLVMELDALPLPASTSRARRYGLRAVTAA